MCNFSNCTFFPYPGITFPSGEVQKKLLLEVYNEAAVDPREVAYVEAHGTGTKAGDPQELNSIVDVFCKQGRTDPLLIGSTKSNMGHPEPASGKSYSIQIVAIDNIQYNNNGTRFFFLFCTCNHCFIQL